MINYGRRIGLHEKPAYGTVIADPFHPLSQGLVGHWLMNEGGGNTVYDISGHGNHGTMTNGPTWGGSKFGGGLNFDGIDDYVDTNHDFSWSSSDLFSLGAWVNVPPNPSNHDYNLISKVNYEYSFFLHSNATLVFNYWGNGGADELTVATDYSNYFNDWHFLVVTYNGDQAKLYIDGVLKDTANKAGEFNHRYETTKIGIGYKYSGASDAHFNGTIDEVRIYNRALSGEEIKQLYHDPFCNLLRVPIRRYAGGLTILDFERAGMRGAFRGIMRGTI